MEQDLSQIRATVVFFPSDLSSARRQSGSHGCAKRAKSTRRQMNDRHVVGIHDVQATGKNSSFYLRDKLKEASD